MVISDISERGLDFSNTRFVPESYHAGLKPDRKPVLGDILYSVVGSLGISVLVDTDRPFCFQRHIALLRPAPLVDNRFLLFAMRSRLVFDQARAVATGSAQMTVPLSGLRKIHLPLPPLAEQGRIVAKVEELLSRVTSARQRLSRVPAVLKRFRQSVLAAACSGRLTACWREQWNGDQGEIPSSWRVLQLGQLTREPLANGRSVPDALGAGFPVLRLTALKKGRIDLGERKSGAWTREAAFQFLVKRGDFLVARGNGSLKLVGRGGLVVEEPDEVAYPDTLIRVRPDQSTLLPEYLAIAWDAPATREQIEATAHTTAGIHKVSQKELRGIRLPIPRLAEQCEIVRRVEALFALADAIEKRVAAATLRVEKLTQAILARAFRGELVPTEAELARQEGRDYEPASALLERIRAGRAQANAAPGAGRRSRSGKRAR